MAIETSELRRRIRAAIELSKKNSAARRTRSDAAAISYETFLEQVAVPAVQQFASALTGEGHLFHVATPAGSVRLTSGASAGDYIELSLDTTQDPPEVIARVNQGRGRRGMTAERPLRERTAVADLTDEDVVTFLVQEITPFLS
ncbi:MAG TPA: hypothetical protein VNJ03_14795 [Vicinamibacterales bacterium]|nr:hypothetical protein [Vicinamibacterales bacterium]